MRRPGFYGSGDGNGFPGVGASGGRTFPRSGWYYTGEMYGAENTNALTQDVEWATRFEVGAIASFDRIAIDVTIAAASAVIRLGIRSDTGTGLPGALLLDAGTVDASGTGVKEITIAQTLTPGRYWLCCALQAAGGVTVRARPVDPFLGQASSATTNGGGFSKTGVAGALPASYGNPGGVGNGPKIMLRAV